MNYIVQTYEDELCVTADTCEVKGDKLVFTVDGAVMVVVQEWFLCAMAKEEECKLKVVK
jgi:hypothetical protein